MDQERVTWTDDDERQAHREGAAWYLWREILTPARYRELAPQPPRTLPPRPRPRQIKPNPDDEEPSRATMPTPDVQRLRRWAVAALVVLVCVIAGGAILSLMGAP